MYTYKSHIKNVVYLPGWAQETDEVADKISTVQQAYIYVPLVFRAVRLRCDTLASVPVQVYDQRDNEVDWPFAISPARFLRMTEAARLWAGAAYWLKKPNAYRPNDLDWLNPFTMKPPKMQTDGTLEFTQEINGQTFGPWEQDFIVYIKDFISPSDDIGPGVSATAVALTDSGLLRYMARFASRFFEAGAMPVTIIGIDGTIDEDERRRVEGFFKKKMSGISNAWRVLAMRLRGTMKPEVLTPKLSEMALPVLHNQATKNIEYAFGIPEGMLRSESNRASAEEHRMSFWQDTVRPSGQAIEDDINEQLFKPMGLRAKIAFDEMDIFQADEAERASSLLRLTQAGMPLEIALDLLGYDLTDEQSAILAARFVVPEVIAMPPALPQEPEMSLEKGIYSELDKWERMASNRAKAGKTVREFESAVIPPALHGAISGALEGVRTIEAVRHVFTQARAWENYP